MSAAGDTICAIASPPGRGQRGVPALAHEADAVAVGRVVDVVRQRVVEDDGVAARDDGRLLVVDEDAAALGRVDVVQRAAAAHAQRRGRRRQVALADHRFGDVVERHRRDLLLRVERHLVAARAGASSREKRDMAESDRAMLGTAADAKAGADDAEPWAGGAHYSQHSRSENSRMM